MTYFLDIVRKNNFYACASSFASRWPLLSISIATLVFFSPFKILMLFGDTGSAFRLGSLFIVAAIAYTLHSIDNKNNSAPLLILYRGIIVLFSIYLLFAVPTLVPEGIGGLFSLESNLYRYAAPVFGLLALWRMSWALPLLIMVKWQKLMLSGAVGLPISVTDYSPVLELGLFVTVGYIIFSLGRYNMGMWGNDEDDVRELTPLDAVFLTAIAVHFSNYFYSGIAKIQLSGDMLTWVLDNKTYFLSYAALKVGALPITALGDTVTKFILDCLENFVVPLNFITIVSQLLSIVAISRIRLSLILTAFFDVVHVVIFLLSGIFFYKWICLNFLIVFGLRKIQKKIVPVAFYLWLMGVIICAPMIFFVASLGWYDTPSFNDQYIEAVMENGDSYRVPSNYMMSQSILYAQQRLTQNVEGVFATRSYASIGGGHVQSNVIDRLMRCAPEDDSYSSVRFMENSDDFDNLMRKHHNFVLKNVNEKGRIAYDFYPHHIFSMPWSYTDFYRLDKNDIVGYRYVVESFCLHSDITYREKEVLWRGEHYVSVK